MPDGDLLTAEDRADLQGLVSSGYRHLRCCVYLFLQIKDAQQARAWLERIAGKAVNGAVYCGVASAAPWSSRQDGSKEKPVWAMQVALTFSGLAKLGLDERALASFPEPFRQGIAEPRRARLLGDTGASAPSHWRVGGPCHPFHILVLRYAVDGVLTDLEQQQLAIDAGCTIVAMERGYLPLKGREHFGFRDGIAQPRIVGLQADGIATGEVVLGHLNERGFYPPTPTVPDDADPHGLLPVYGDPSRPGLRDLGKNGTYLVYRQLCQDVGGFWRFALAETRRTDGRFDVRRAEALAARMVGRWPGGAPLALAPERDDRALADDDDFGYDDDPRGLRCPIGSHVRRANPRDHLGLASPQVARRLTASRRMLRRGRLFGPPWLDPLLLTGPGFAAALASLVTGEPSSEEKVARGMHFLAINSDLEGQFEHVQQRWCNSPSFNGLTDNRDPLIGAHDSAALPASRMRLPGCPWRRRTSPLPRFVTVTGGAYLFLPGLAALRYLAKL